MFLAIFCQGRFKDEKPHDGFVVNGSFYVRKRQLKQCWQYGFIGIHGFLRSGAWSAWLPTVRIIHATVDRHALSQRQARVRAPPKCRDPSPASTDGAHRFVGRIETFSPWDPNRHSLEAGRAGRTRFDPQISPISADAGRLRSRGGRTTTKGAKGRRSSILASP